MNKGYHFDEYDKLLLDCFVQQGDPEKARRDEETRKKKSKPKNISSGNKKGNSA